MRVEFHLISLEIKRETNSLINDEFFQQIDPKLTFFSLLRRGLPLLEISRTAITNEHL